MSFSIIIPTLNVNNYLVKNIILLHSCFRRKNIDFEILIINNNIRIDLNKSKLLRLKYVSIFKYTQQSGSYVARNYGVKKSNKKILIFLDNDIVVTKNWLRFICSITFENPHVFFTGPVKIISESNNFWSNYDKCFAFPQKYISKKNLTVTANLIVPKDIFLKVGYFDENRYSGSDMLWCKNALNKNIKISYQEELEILHPARESLKELFNKSMRVLVGKYSDKIENKLFIFLLCIYQLRIPINMIFVALYRNINKFTLLKGILILFLLRVKIFIFLFISLFNGLDKYENK